MMMYHRITLPRLVLTLGSILLSGAALAFGQEQINLVAAPGSLTLPDGNGVPMWGYSCGALITGSKATCAKLNPTATGWSPVVITVAPEALSSGLTINLSNNLIFANGNKVATSLTVVGQMGGGLGKPMLDSNPVPHSPLSPTWPIASNSPLFTPPVQSPRVRSFGTEVPAGTTAALTWINLNQGTYLIESGTHPSIQGAMGLYGILVVTQASAAGIAGIAYGTGTTTVKYDADIPLLMSEIDPVQNQAVSTAVNTSGFSETTVWSGQPTGCGNPASSTYNTCYPPVVNYSPLYYLFNGVAFDKTNSQASLFGATISTPPVGKTLTGNVLVRFVNAGLRMHVPSIVGSLAGKANAVPGFSLIAEDGNVLPGVSRVQSEVFMAAGKTYDVMISSPATTTAPALPVFDRELSLSGNSINRDAGMLAYLSINGAKLPQSAALTAAKANADNYPSVVLGKTLTVSDSAKGVLHNDLNIYGVKVVTPPAKGTVSLNTDGTFTYVPSASWAASDSFVYCGNGAALISPLPATCATVTLGAAKIEGGAGIAMGNISYTSTMATYLSIKTPGVLSVDKDGENFPLTVKVNSVLIPSGSGLAVNMDANGGFTASVPHAGTYSFQYQAQNSQGSVSSTAATVTLTFPTPTNLAVTVLDGIDQKTAITDYRWIIEEDRSFYIDPTKTTNTGTNIVPTLGVNFHTSYMPFVAQGCTGTLSCGGGQTSQGKPVVCDVGNGVCRPDATGNGRTAVFPSQVALDATKRYYISVLPGDAGAPFASGNMSANCANGAGNNTSTSNPCGHTMGGAPIAFGQTAVKVMVQPTPLPTGKLSVVVFEDDFPLNGEQDSGGGVDVLSPNEPGLGGFQIHLFDAMAQNGDFTGQMTYDMFNQPLTNSLAGTKDPSTGADACPIAKNDTSTTAGQTTGMIVTCPKYESDGTTPSPLAGQALINNLMPGRWGVVATPGADRIARGEEWLQTNTLDGQKAHDVFTRVGEPSYFQEYGPAGYHVKIGFANPALINARKAPVCAGADVNVGPTNGCPNTITGKVTTERISRTPDERLYSSGSHDSFAFTQCYVSVGDPDGEDFAFTRCAADGTFSISGLPDGNWRVTVFDQWNDALVDGLSTPVGLGPDYGPCKAGTSNHTCNLGDIATNQWQANLYTRTFIDENKDGVSQSNEAGIPLIPVSIRMRDGSMENNLLTDFTGTANFNETFPLFSWYTVETDNTRYKTTGMHVVYDAGGPADGTTCGGSYPACGTSVIGKNLANTVEKFSVPTNLRVPGAVYCDNADCNRFSIQNGSSSSATGNLSTGRIDPPWVSVEGFQGFSGQNNFIEFGKTPYAPGENGGIQGHVVYASTRPFDDPTMLVQAQWEPLVPHVTINLYQESFAGDGITPTLQLVDSTQTSSFDDWAQGVRSDGLPNMNCPGQSDKDLFYFSLYNQPNYLNAYNNQHSGTPLATLPNNSQYKCYDGMHNWNQIQPAPYDGMYKFPSIAGLDPVSGKPTGGTNTNVIGTNCLTCVKNPVDGMPMLPSGKYVVEVVVPPGFELVKEEDKNILIGDNYIAPTTQEFGNLGTTIFILPDQAQVAGSYNANNPQNPTNSLGASPTNSTVPGSPVEPVWPCVGEARIVPDFISLFPGSQEVAPFAGATRNLCDRKEVTLGDEMGTTAKFYIYTSTHIASKFTGVITDDFTSEFDPFSPQFGEKFAPPDLPVSVKDWTGNEISRVYADQWGAYNGMQYSTWEVNPPNPTGYSPTMAIFCMNDRGSGKTPDPLFNPGYSQFCYELPFMPGTTEYLDTPVVPTSAFSEGYNHPDCAYPDSTPSISEVDGDGVGPWILQSGPVHPLTIKALGNVAVVNNGYSGPSSTKPPFNQKTVSRHYGFGTAQGGVTIGGRNAVVQSWSDSQITVFLPISNNVPNCAIQQQDMYRNPQDGDPPAQCGQLIVTTAAGQQSVDTVTVTIGGKAPIYVTSTIQSAIDKALPGDLIMVPPGTYNEMVLMWKPVQLQGVGAASTVINANAHPAGKLDPWRRQATCLFGIAINGTPISPTNPFDPNPKGFTCPAAMNFAVDRLPLEAVVGWDATLNGNLAELLQEPTLLGAYEGAGITVMGKGVAFPTGSNPYASDTFPDGTALLTKDDCGDDGGTNPYPSNFWCNPSRIDGLSIRDSSQGGGGIFVHAWNHNLEISNNRVFNNTGTLTGGITVGQGEFPPQYTVNGTIEVPGSCEESEADGVQLPYCFNEHVNLHNNAVTLNSTLGDELFSTTLTGAGGVTFCTGADYYKFNYNWVCGNVTSGEGGGLAHLGWSKNGHIDHNAILFNQSTNPTVPTNGGGIMIMGAPDTDPTACSAAPDADCPPGLSDGIGPGLMINANLIMGNAADSGSGGGIRFQGVNGTEVATFPQNPERWYKVQVTNNIITNNVAGWDGAGISLQDSLSVNIINNTIMSNDSTASAGPLFNTLGAPNASAPSPGQTAKGSSSLPQPSGLVAIQNSAVLTASFAGTHGSNCPNNHPNCTSFSNPYLANNIFWQNRSFYIGVGKMDPNYQQNVISLYNSSFTAGTAGTPAASQTATGACPTGSTYWDIGVRGDMGPANHSSKGTLNPQYSILTDAGDYQGGHNIGSNPNAVSQYCNGSRVPPEAHLTAGGWQVPPGISDATVPNPIFSLQPAATVDEGNNWVNISWGPLAMTNPVNGTTLGNYSLKVGSPAIDAISPNAATYNDAPATDFFGNPRPDATNPNGNQNIDIGAVEYGTVNPTLTGMNPSTGFRGTTVPITLTGNFPGGATDVIITGGGISVGPLVTKGQNTVTTTFTIGVDAPLIARNVTVVTADGNTNVLTFTPTDAALPTLTSISPSIGGAGTTVHVTLNGTYLSGAAAPAVMIDGGGITVKNIAVVSDTTITVDFTIAAAASASPRTVTVVTTPGGTSNGLPFTVTDQVAPTLVSLNPATGERGTTVPIVITGSNFKPKTAAPTLNVSGDNNVTATITSSSGIQITANIKIAPTAALDPRMLTVTTTNGTSAPAYFAITAPPPPVVTGISPASAPAGSTVTVVLSGSNLSGATLVDIGGNFLNVGTPTSNANGTVSAVVTISTRAVPGDKNATVTTPGGTSSPVTFTVTAAAN